MRNLQLERPNAAFAESSRNDLTGYFKIGSRVGKIKMERMTDNIKMARRPPTLQSST